MGAHELADRIATISELDRVARPVADAVHQVLPSGPLKDVLSGTWLGHPLHPLLTDIPIGSFTSATILDFLGGKRARTASEVLIGLGVAAAVPTALAGLSDWSDTYGGHQRIGVVHATANLAGITCYAASLRARLRGHHYRGMLLALAGMGVMTVGGYLGGHLVYGSGVGVNNTFWQETPADWTPALDEEALPEGKPVHVQVKGADVLLYRAPGETLPRAIGSRCTHAGGPLAEGTVQDSLPGAECIKCPWHGSVFRLTDGSVVHGPATVAEPAYEVRIDEGKIQVRARPS
jgi:nitrite reductase/ring-hydroxylating ferredoxin subunit/uncharacterized membrane protein